MRLSREIVKVSEPPSHPLIQKLQRTFPPSQLEISNQNCGGALDRNRYPDTLTSGKQCCSVMRRPGRSFFFSPEFSWVTGTKVPSRAPQIRIGTKCAQTNEGEILRATLHERSYDVLWEALQRPYAERDSWVTSSGSLVNTGKAAVSWIRKCILRVTVICN